MKLLLLNHIQNARDSLRANRMRAFLTVTGVTIGVTSIVTILSLATGASRIVAEQVDQLGGNITVIRPNTPEAGNLNTLANQQSSGTFMGSTLSERDVTQITALEHVSAVAPLMLIPGTLRAESDAPASSMIVGTTPDILPIASLTLQQGAFPDDPAQMIGVIGAQLSIDLFGTEDSLGKTFTIRGVAYRVGGVLARHTGPVNFNGVDFNSSALISPDQVRRLNQSPQIQQINVQADSVAHLEQVEAAIDTILLESHGGERDFVLLTGTEIAEPTSRLFLVIAGVTAAIAAVSLLVGGIGIMNIMLVNVAERTREIGIRKALGATHSDIVWQFLIESLILGVLGGIIGTVLGFGLAFVISLFLTFDPFVTWHTPVLALGVATVVGLIFGLYPAFRAARKDPIESLRQLL